MFLKATAPASFERAIKPIAVLAEIAREIVLDGEDKRSAEYQPQEAEHSETDHDSAI